MVDNEELGERFRQLAVTVVAARTARGWQRRDLAERTACALATIVGVEQGRPQYGHHSFQRTARVLEDAFGWSSGSVWALVEDGIPIADLPGDATTGSGLAVISEP